MDKEFRKIKSSVLNTIFLKIGYISGDADSFEYEEHRLDSKITFANHKEHVELINDEIDKFKVLSTFTDINNTIVPKNISDKRQYIEEHYSKELSEMFDNIPQDVMNIDELAHLSSIYLCGYNDIGEYFEKQM
jgi:hypothetical protein